MYLWIAVGSALGGMARYWCTGFAAGMLGETFPWGTLLVNITGSLIIGFFATLTGPDGRDCGQRGQDRPIAAIEPMMGSALVTTEKVKVIRYGESGPSDTP
jgi:fluoride ion exporter CrcB/FEX